MYYEMNIEKYNVLVKRGLLCIVHFIASSRAILLLIDSKRITLPPNTVKITISDKLIENAHLKTNTVPRKKKFEDSC